MTVDKELLFKSRLPEADVEVEGVGTVRVRGLSRTEALAVAKVVDDGEGAIERTMLAAALVDPVLTEDEVRRWQEASIMGELQPVTEKVMELSGMSEDSAKETYEELASDSDAEFRDVPGAEAVDDGGAPADGDVGG